MKLRLGVIGVGHLGKFHAQKLAELPDVSLDFVVDLDEERLRCVSETLEKNYGIKVFTTQNYKELLKKVDAVIIATPTFTHYEIAKEFLKEGIHVFLEKPMCSTFSEAVELVELAEKRNLVFQVGYIERFHPAFKKLVKEVKKPLFIEAHRLSPFPYRNLDIDVILDLMIHDIDMVILLVNEEEVELIHAVGAPVFTKLPDIVNARIVFKNGTTCNLTASRISVGKQRRFRVFEPGRYHSVDTLKNTYESIEVKNKVMDYDVDKEVFSEVDPLKEELKSFISAVIGESPCEVSGRDALKSLSLALRLKKEVEKNLRKFL